MSRYGIVKCFYETKGFGFISDQGSPDVFVHISDVVGQKLVNGDRVSYELVHANGKARATRVAGGTGAKLEMKGSRKGKGKGKGGNKSTKGQHFGRAGVDALECAKLELSGIAIEAGDPAALVDVLEEIPNDLRDVSEDVDEVEGGEGISVGTYNLLHPIYAENYSEVEGVVQDSGCSNWLQRAPAIATLLRDGNLDVYFLQEVGLKEIVDLRRLLGGQSPPKKTEGTVVGYVFDMGFYDCVHFTHPSRAANDGVAVLVHRGRLKLLNQQAVPFLGKGVGDALSGEPYMCAALALAEDAWGQRVVFVSTHFYEQKGGETPGCLAHAPRTFASRS
ncbi:unnamed protein product [Prorocentrum cordatum]|uniref:CSD domain-containing protein n=1 Tax=Prorocentrum cordatum TaxID=2364126 RepID=A0ABN9XYJ5_9DINO|nr:unnamed protein product [Polarella glacialis]